MSQIWRFSTFPLLIMLEQQQFDLSISAFSTLTAVRHLYLLTAYTSNSQGHRRTIIVRLIPSSRRTIVAGDRIICHPPSFSGSATIIFSTSLTICDTVTTSLFLWSLARCCSSPPLCHQFRMSMTS
ncbi:uncharacterized protein LOC110269028 [Arachis ipaensis]|uniref:uncharacterized protein LOC110269028 n=1 Tax=Arachis ipaensis TaxID=130454 RepID=UPI000A2B6A98|nr:uncharacterized protein LOC110269028 [Arachis ipaensis]